MNVKEFIDSIKAGSLGEVDIYRYLKDVDRRALQDLYDRVYIAAVACVNEFGQGHRNLCKASTIIAKYSKDSYNLSVDWLEADRLDEIHNLKDALIAHVNEGITDEQLFEWMGIENPNDEDLILHQKYSSKLPIPEEWKEPQHDNKSNSTIKLPEELNTATAVRIFTMAISKGWIEPRANGLKWIGVGRRPNVAQLAYLCGRVYGYVYRNGRNEGEHIPYEALGKLFGVTRLDRSLSQVYEAKNPQFWRKDIDNLFD